MILCSLKHFHTRSFISAPYSSGELAQWTLIFSPSYGQETEDSGGEGTYPKSHSFKQQSKLKNYSAVFDKVDFAA